jgi:hypothetical protein
LAAKLIDSLDPEQDEDVEAAWHAEIRKRIEQLDTRQVQPIPWSEALRFIEDNRDEAPNCTAAELSVKGAVTCMLHKSS